jgi:hypothetical protein
MPPNDILLGEALLREESIIIKTEMDAISRGTSKAGTH